MSIFDDLDSDFGDLDSEEQPALRCKICGSEDVRWRHQGDRWVLFSLQPGVVHVCDADSLADDFDAS